jgi:hypothetical protein
MIGDVEGGWELGGVLRRVERRMLVEWYEAKGVWE